MIVLQSILGSVPPLRVSPRLPAESTGACPGGAAERFYGHQPTTNNPENQTLTTNT